MPLEQLIERQKLFEIASVRMSELPEFAAGICYARKNGVPVYCIDECTYPPNERTGQFEVAIKTNVNEGDNFELFSWKEEWNPDLNSLYASRETLSRETLSREPAYQRYTRRNAFMAFAINYHFSVSGYSNIVHIGGRAHYDPARSIPIQSLVIADSIDMIDAVEKVQVKLK